MVDPPRERALAADRVRWNPPMLRTVDSRSARTSSRWRWIFQSEEREERAMPENKPTFIWYELMTSDPDSAADFYRGVVGWNTSDAGQPDMQYTILSVGDRGIGGVMAIPAEAARTGARPAWLGYVGVPNTDDFAKRIVEAGGAL